MKAVHGDKYILDKAVYKNIKQKVVIVCREHGEFLATPDHLLLGKPTGCNQCGIDSHVYTTEEFIEIAKKKCKHSFNYSLVNYVQYNIPIKLICEKGHVFERRPKLHLGRGNQCPICSNNFPKNLNSFITDARKVHGGRYDYSKSDYITSKTKTIITCPIHGDFLMKPNCHLNGKGCPDCANSKGEDAIIQFLTKNNIGFIKQATFPGCRSKALLRFDFYLPAHNTCIEFDGYWHFNPFKGDMEQFSSTKKRDRIKNIYCRENHIPLIRISDLKNIEPTLTKLLLN